MQLKTQLFIDGKWQDGQSTIAVTDPSDESIIANVAVASDAHCLAAIDAARRAFKSWAKTAPRFRGEILYAAEFFRWFSEEAVRVNGEFRTAPNGD
ncbi:MAG: aldehyde dehydrogenase family protein, partial [Actinobacteria bacterium]|nr:aldehyde dehydrogenase family protein [Actinomycetota bacterium]